MTESYSEMVNRLAKSGDEILATVTPEKMHLLHMAVGIAGEATELLGAFGNDKGPGFGLDMENVIEEMGDYEFYAEGARQGLKQERMPVDSEQPRTNSPTVLHRLAADVAVAAGDFLDLVKKATVYNKDVGTDALLADLHGVDQAYADLQSALGLNRENILKGNQDKLSTGKNARYKDGYSDKAAQERADKKEVPTYNAKDVEVTIGGDKVEGFSTEEPVAVKKQKRGKGKGALSGDSDNAE